MADGKEHILLLGELKFDSRAHVWGHITAQNSSSRDSHTSGLQGHWHSHAYNSQTHKHN